MRDAASSPTLRRARPRYSAIVCRITILTSAALVSGAEAHPRCDIGQPYATLKKQYSRVVRARPVIVTEFHDNQVWAGSVTLVSPKYKKWPKRELRPNPLKVGFRHQYGSDCDWFPNPKARVFVLDRVNKDLVTVSSFED